MGSTLTHIALHVRDREASLRFYQDWCGMVDCSPAAGLASPWLATPGQERDFHLVLVPGARHPHEQAPDDATHIGVMVESREVLEKLYSRARNENLLREDLQTDGQGCGSFSMHDPDGNIVQFRTGGAQFLSRTFNDLSLHVQDLEITRRFYKEWTGMKADGRGQDGENAQLASDPDAAFRLILLPGARKPCGQPDHDISHIGIVVDSEETLKEIYHRAQEAGLVRWRLHERKWPAGKLFSIRDPDGRTVEFSYGQPSFGDLNDGGGAKCPLSL
jgi:catechol 2,3-dioxygenase-like lactoylglutathione lyase family enzyme